MMSEYVKALIRGEVDNALSALLAIRTANYLHPMYLKEKLRTVRNCLEFMESFCEDDDDGQ